MRKREREVKEVNIEFKRMIQRERNGILFEEVLIYTILTHLIGRSVSDVWAYCFDFSFMQFSNSVIIPEKKITPFKIKKKKRVNSDFHLFPCSVNEESWF